MKFAAGCLTIVVSTLLSIPINGFVLSAMWEWFIVPIFKIRPISITEAVGLSIAITFLAAVVNSKKYTDIGMRASNKTSDTSEDEQIAKLAGASFSAAILGPLFSYAIGWVWHTFFMPVYYSY